MLAPTLTLVLPMDLGRNQIWYAESVALTTKPLLLLYTFIEKEGFFFGICCLEYVQKYATEAALREQESLNSSSESSLSDFSEDETQEMEL